MLIFDLNRALLGFRIMDAGNRRAMSRIGDPEGVSREDLVG